MVKFKPFPFQSLDYSIQLLVAEQVAKDSSKRRAYYGDDQQVRLTASFNDADPPKVRVNTSMKPYHLCRSLREGGMHVLRDAGLLKVHVKPAWTDFRTVSSIEKRLQQHIENALTGDFLRAAQYLRIDVPETNEEDEHYGAAAFSRSPFNLSTFPNLQALYLNGDFLSDVLECKWHTPSGAFNTIRSNWLKFGLDLQMLLKHTHCSICDLSTPSRKLDIYITSQLRLDPDYKTAYDDRLRAEKAEREALGTTDQPIAFEEDFKPLDLRGYGGLPVLIKAISEPACSSDCQKYKYEWYRAFDSAQVLAHDDTTFKILSCDPNNLWIFGKHKVSLYHDGERVSVWADPEDCMWPTMIELMEKVGIRHADPDLYEWRNIEYTQTEVDQIYEHSRTWRQHFRCCWSFDADIYLKEESSEEESSEEESSEERSDESEEDSEEGEEEEDGDESEGG